MTDPQLLIDAARYAHILVIAVGFGAAFLADYQILSCLRRPIDDRLLHVLDLCHNIIWKMVIGMWITGLILIQLRTQFVLENFTPKLVSKLVTVAILTANAGLISHIAMPLIRSSRGRSLFALPTGSKLMLGIVGAVSSASWMLAMAMGSSKVLAASSAGVFILLLPLIYISAVLLAIGLMSWGGMLAASVSGQRAQTAHKARQTAQTAPLVIAAE
jgi:hypothetical protein